MQALCRSVAPMITTRASGSGFAASRPGGRRVHHGARRRDAVVNVKPRTRVIRRVTETEEPTEDDFATFNNVVGGGDWDKVQRQVREAAVEGKITPGVLGAAYTPYLEVYEKCKIGGENEAVLKTLENVIVLLTQTLQQLNATPAVRLVDALMVYDPTAQGDEVRETMKKAFESGDVNADELEASLTMMIDSMSEQDEAWEAHVAQAVETTSKEEFEQLVAHANGRMEAKRRLTQLRTMCGGGGGEADDDA